MSIKHRGIIFDLDGTLVDTLEDIAVSVNRALKLRGFPEHKAEEYREKIGWGMKRITVLALPEEVRQEEIAATIADDASRFYLETPLFYSRPYPGMLELVAELGRKKIKTAVLTNKPDSIAQKIIAGIFPPGSFNVIQGEISGKPRKPDPACVWELLVELNLTPADIVFVGDSDIDMETALASGCFPLGVSWGFRSRQIIERAGARRIIERPEELLDFFQERL